MSDRAPRPTDEMLQRALADLGTQIAYPPTPPVAPTVRDRLVAGPQRRRPFWPVWFSPRRSLAWVAVVVALLVVAGLVSSPEARTTIADRIGLRGVEIEHVPAVPEPAPTAPAAPSSPSPTPVPVGVRLDLGDPVTLAEARARVPYAVRVPTAPELAAPDQVFVRPFPPGGQVALVYRAGPGLPESAETGVGLLLTQFPGGVDWGFVQKGLGPDTRLETVLVNGTLGYWIEGRPHAFLYRDTTGSIRDETYRLAGNVLLWQDGDLLLRLESALSKEEALRIAHSVR